MNTLAWLSFLFTFSNKSFPQAKLKGKALVFWRRLCEKLSWLGQGEMVFQHKAVNHCSASRPRPGLPEELEESAD